MDTAQNMSPIIIKVSAQTFWLTFEPLVSYSSVKSKHHETGEFLCYFNPSLPLNVVYGEIVRDSTGRPKIFRDKEDAEIFAINYIKRRFQL
jgi:hypothetical protein